MVYITKSNADRILRCTTTTMDTVGEVYHKKLYMFTKRELTHLLRYKNLMENPDSYFASFKVVSKRTDSFTFVNETDKPSYHSDRNCDRLNSAFSNYIIPQEIQALGEDKCREFRKWFKKNEGLLEDDADKFYKRLKKKYGVTEIQKVERGNSGTVQFVDLSVEELEEEIDNLITLTNKYRHKPNVLPILKAYSKYYYLVKDGYVIPEITTDHTNEEIVKVLMEYKTEYKRPLETLLKTYFRAKYNPDLKYDESILKQLGFTPCKHCCTKP